MDKTDYFGSIPDIVLLKILSNLSGEDLLTAGVVSVRFHSLSNYEQLWEKPANNKCVCYSPLNIQETQFYKTQPYKAATMRAIKTHNQFTKSLTPTVHNKRVIVDFELLCMGKQLLICKRDVYEDDRGIFDGTLSAWSIDTAGLVQRFVGHDERDSPRQAIISLDDVTLVSGADRSLRVWDVASGQCLHVFMVQRNGPPRPMSFCDKTVACTSGEFIMKVWDAETGVEPYILPVNSSSIWTVRMNADFLAYTHKNGFAKVFNRKTGEEKQIFHFDGRNIARSLLDGGRIVLSVRQERGMAYDAYVCDIHTGQYFIIANLPSMNTFVDGGSVTSVQSYICSIIGMAAIAMNRFLSVVCFNRKLWTGRTTKVAIMVQWCSALFYALCSLHPDTYQKMISDSSYVKVSPNSTWNIILDLHGLAMLGVCNPTVLVCYTACTVKLVHYKSTNSHLEGNNFGREIKLFAQGVVLSLFLVVQFIAFGSMLFMCGHNHCSEWHLVLNHIGAYGNFYSSAPIAFAMSSDLRKHARLLMARSNS